jgi:hypothetical protein
MASDAGRSWQPWIVCPESGFEVWSDTAPAVVSLRQVDARRFAVGARFRFRQPRVTEKLVVHMGKVGAFDTDEQRREAIAAASDYGPDDSLTDLASIPQFLRWFANSYGEHTLAAIIHDRLITSTPNGGCLHSDVVADRFFREMLHGCGTPFVKRWVMWTAVALRTRWKAGGWKRAKVAAWALSSVVGIGGTIWLLVAGQPLAAIALGFGLLLVAGVLWGRQWGAAIFAAIALPWIGPAAALALVATAVFWLLDRLARRFDAPFPVPPPELRPEPAP